MKLRMEKMRLAPSTGLMRENSGLIGSPENSTPRMVTILVRITQTTVTPRIGKAVRNSTCWALSSRRGQTVAKGST